MGLIAQVTSNAWQGYTNCTRRSRVLLTLPVLVMSAINPLLHEYIAILLIVNRCDAVLRTFLAAVSVKKICCGRNSTFQGIVGNIKALHGVSVVLEQRKLPKRVSGVIRSVR